MAKQEEITDDNIQIGMPVIYRDGVLVGKIVDSDKNSSKMILITDSNSSIGTYIQNETNSPGIVMGKLGLSLEMQLIPQSEEIKIKTKDGEEELIAYPAGSKILKKELNFLTGGGGTNTAVAFSRLGLNVAYLGKMGQGSNSGLIVKRLRKEKVKFVGVNSKTFHAGYSVILDSLSGDRTILTYKGANNHLRFSEINKRKIKAKWFYFSSMIGESYKTLEKLAIFGKENGIKIAFNPSNYLAEKGSEFLGKLLLNTDLLILNKEESELIVGKGEIKHLIQKLMELGPKEVIITDGKKGAYTISKNYFYNVVPHKVHAVETTGAGDAFASTYLASKIMGKEIIDSLKLASSNSGSVVQNRGAKNGLLEYKPLLLESKKYPAKIKKKKI